MKSYVSYLQGLYSAMFLDIAEQIPSLRRDCERDSSRLLSLIESRGLSFLMIDLPEMCKHLDRCVAHRRLTPSGLTGQRPYSRRGVIPRLFKGLYLRVFDEFGLLRADSDAVAYRLLRQLLLASKKVKVSCSDSSTWKHVNEFFETDRKVRSPSLNWDDDELRASRLRDLHFGDPCGASPAPLLGICDSRFTDVEESVPSVEWDFLDCTQRVADAVTSTLGGFNPSDWRPKHGPGAVADQRHTQFKYDFPTWPAKLDAIFPMSQFAFANYGGWVDHVTGVSSCKALLSLHEAPSRLITVPRL